jgi:hypothetical protein
VLLWDTDASNSPVQAIEKAHGSCDVHTVDWSGLQEHLIVTGECMGCLMLWSGGTGVHIALLDVCHTWGGSTDVPCRDCHVVLL